MGKQAPCAEARPALYAPSGRAPLVLAESGACLAVTHDRLNALPEAQHPPISPPQRCAQKPLYDHPTQHTRTVAPRQADRQ